MRKILISWIGGNDLKAIQSSSRGPVCQTLQDLEFSLVYLLYNYPQKDVTPYLRWLRTQTDTEISAQTAKLSSPIHFADIFNNSRELLTQVKNKHPDDEISILLSPGTPAMQAVWILLGKTSFPVKFIQSTLEQGTQYVDIPFDISAEFLPSASFAGETITALMNYDAAIDAAFDDIITQNPTMLELKAKASKMATTDVPVLIYGETGTGKELFATAIHNASDRKEGAFISVNCGAIPVDLIDSVLFGHLKGSFTGAINDRKGFFEEADQGTIFLDEFGELSLDAQVRLLRVLQSSEITPVGSSSNKKIDVRVIAATNRNLMAEVAKGNFREDLFYRIAVGVLHIPPLREREGDINLLVSHILLLLGQKQKNISVKAKNILLKHPWKGNVRELYTTLLRALMWSNSDKITEGEIKSALFYMPENGDRILNRSLNNSFELQGVIDEVVAHYMQRAIIEAGGNKTKAAELLGLSSYQTLKNWIRKHGVKV